MPTGVWRLLLAVYRCRKGKHEFTAAMPPDHFYGALFYRTRTPGRMAVLHSLIDPVFDDVRAILQCEQSFARLSVDRQRRLLQNVVGAICDRDERGETFSADADPACTVCGRANVRYLHDTSPEEYGEFTVPELTHSTWDMLDRDARQQRVRALLEQRIAQRRS